MLAILGIVRKTRMVFISTAEGSEWSSNVTLKSYSQDSSSKKLYFCDKNGQCCLCFHFFSFFVCVCVFVFFVLYFVVVLFCVCVFFLFCFVFVCLFVFVFFFLLKTAVLFIVPLNSAWCRCGFLMTYTCIC